MRTKIFTLFFLVLAGVVVYALYNTIEFYDETTEGDWSNAAKRNPYLAAEQFLRLRGHAVQSSNSLHSLDKLPASGTVFMSQNRRTLKPHRVDALLQWLAQGGHLIVTAHFYPDDSRDPLLKQFSVTKDVASCDCENNEDKSDDFEQKKISELLREANEQLKQQQKKQKKRDKDTDEPDPVSESEISVLQFDGVADPIKIHFNPKHILHHPYIDVDEQSASGRGDFEGPSPLYWGGSKSGTQFIQFNIGDGLLTVLSDPMIWQSHSIDELDHAYLLSVLTGNKADVLILYGMQMPSILSLLGNHAPEFLYTALLCLIMWLIYQLRRFGPIRKHDTLIRRSLEEHIQACSKLLWHSKQAEKLLQNIHHAINRRLRQIDPGIDNLDKQKQIAWISKKCDLSEAEVEFAMYPTECNSQDQFLKTVRLLQKIGNHL